MAEPKPPRKPAAKKPTAKKPTAKKAAPKKAAPKKPPEQDLEIGDDFLDDLDARLDEVVLASTEEHPAPAGASEAISDEGRLDDQDQPEDDELEDDKDEKEDLDEDDEEERAEVEQPTKVVRASGDGELGRPRPRFPLWARFITATFLIVTSVAAATAASGFVFLNDFASALTHGGVLKSLEPDLSKIHGSGPETFLIIGSDHRKGQGAGRGLSDTAILLRVDPNRNAIALMSIPRDLVVQIPGVGTNKFNAAFSLGGAKLTLETVKQLTGLGRNGLPGINHVVNVDFTGFAEAVTAIGCVYVDVDRRYYHSNQGLSAAAQYAEINIPAGYQRLCGYPALSYVRYRHADNDIVRNARQQDFLREARSRVPATDLLIRRHDLIDIFTKYTTSDIGDAATALDVIKLFISARSEPIKEVHFPGTVGAKVTVTPGQMEQAVSQFLGTEGTKGPRGASAQPAGGPKPIETPPSSRKAKKPAAPAKKSKPSPNASGLEGGKYGKSLAYRVQSRNRTFPVYYPTTIVAGSQYDQKPRAYTLADPALAPNQRFGYRYVLKTPTGDYYGLQGLQWKDPPILSEPHETKTIGGRTYNLYFDNDRLRLISWSTNAGVYWVSNSLLESLSADQMLAIARGAKVLGPRA